MNWDFMKENMFNKTVELIRVSWKYILLLLLISIPIFAQLGTFPIREWDEARLAQNAYEMLNNENFITTYAGGNPDMWNTKPPLMIWLQVLSMKMFGVNEFAVRFPSAMAALFTCVALLFFSLRYMRSFWFGFICVLVLMTSAGYVSPHSIRTGDYDALLTLFTTVGVLSFFVFTENHKIKYLYTFFGCMALAVLTKSVVALLFLPAIFIYALIERQLIVLLKNKHFYFGLCGFIFIVVGYYLIREADNPGYINAVYENELGGRYLKTLEGHCHPFDYYFNNLMQSRFYYWLWMLPFGILIGLLHKENKIGRVTLFCSLTSFLFFLIISLAETKILWYDVPLYPFLAIIVAVFIFFIFNFFETNIYIAKNLKYNIAPLVFILLIFRTPYLETAERITTPVEDDLMRNYHSIGYYLRDMLNETRQAEDCHVCFNGYFAQNLFYVNLLKEKGIDIDYETKWEDLEVNDIVIVTQIGIKEDIENNYGFELLDSIDNLNKYKITSKKIN